MIEERADLMRLPPEMDSNLIRAELQATRVITHSLWRAILRLAPNWRHEVNKTIEIGMGEIGEVGVPGVDPEAKELAIQHAMKLFMTTFTLDLHDQEMLDALSDNRGGTR